MASKPLLVHTKEISQHELASEFRESSSSFSVYLLTAPVLRHDSTITTGDLGGIQRVDIRMFAWRYSSKQLLDITKDMIAVAVIISSVDPKLVSDFSIRTLVQEQFGDLPLESQKTLLKTIEDAKRESSG